MRRIFVFGSNRQGLHGKGSALEAKKHYGAINGQAEGLQGNSYAIITKELRDDHKPVTLKEIKDGVKRFLKFAKQHPELTFDVQAIGCGLAGRTPKQVAPMFWGHSSNVKLPKPFIKWCRKLEDRFYRAWKVSFPDLPKPVRQYKFHSKRKWRFDFAWPEFKIAVEIQGGSFTFGGHNRGFSQSRDFEKHNAATILGWKVLYFNTKMINLVDTGMVYNCVETTAELLLGEQ